MAEPHCNTHRRSTEDSVPDGGHNGGNACIKLGIGLDHGVEVIVTLYSQVVKRHRLLCEVALWILGWLQANEDGFQDSHQVSGMLSDHWKHLQGQTVSYMQYIRSVYSLCDVLNNSIEHSAVK